MLQSVLPLSPGSSDAAVAAAIARSGANEPQRSGQADPATEATDGLGLPEYSETTGTRGVLKKANEAVVMTPVSGDFIFLSRKTFNVLLYHAQQQGLRENNRFGIPYSVLRRDAGFNSKDMEVLKDRFRNLIRTTIEWGWVGDALDEAPQRLWSVTALLADAYFEINSRTRELWLYWSYSDTLKRQLLESRSYTKLSLAMMARLRSLPALSLYEIAARYQTNPSGVGRKLPWQQWVVILRGKPVTDYPTLDYRRFNKETLVPAAAQVNREQDDFEVGFKEFRTGRRITHLQLVLKPGKDRPAGTGGPDSELRSRMDLGLFNRLLAMGVPQYTADAIYGSCDERVLRAAIEQVEARLANRKMAKVASVEAYLKERIRSLRDDIEQAREQSAGAAPAVAAPAGGNDGHSRPAGGSTSLQAQLPRLRDEYVRHHITLARALFQEMAEPQRLEWVGRFETERLPTTFENVKTAYRKNGLKSAVASASFYAWLSEATWNPDPDQLALIDFGIAEGLVRFGGDTRP
jgi:hypothetical protein